MKNLIAFFIIIVFLSSCDSTTNNPKEPVNNDVPKSYEGKHCFVEAIPQESFVTDSGDTIQFIDSTVLYITIVGDKVTGRFDWMPAERDGAYGSIDGTIKDDIIKALYSYTIEGFDEKEERTFRMLDDKIGMVMEETELFLPRVDCK